MCALNFRSVTNVRTISSQVSPMCALNFDKRYLLIGISGDVDKAEF